MLSYSALTTESRIKDSILGPIVDFIVAFLDFLASGYQPGYIRVMNDTIVPSAPTEKKSWLARLGAGLSRSTSRLTDGIAAIFTKRRLDDVALEELEELLISADLGPHLAARLVAEFRRERFGKEVSSEEVRTALADLMIPILQPVAHPLVVDRTKKPFVVLVTGVNGSGKTTTIGKLARQFQDQGLRVMLAAGDTFRAAAVEQLKIWGQRNNCPVIAGHNGADAAGLAFEAVQQAQQQNMDVLLIDTAGRLQNKANLMEELAKILRVIRKIDQSAPHASLLVLDATIGQNAHAQVDVFQKTADVTGLVVTKLDGSARGGVLVALAEKYQLPVYAIGVGEGIDDLQPFEAASFARALVGVIE